MQRTFAFRLDPCLRQPSRATRLRVVKKLDEAAKEARTIRSTVPLERRVQVIREATSRVSAKAAIDFRRELRK